MISNIILILALILLIVIVIKAGVKIANILIIVLILAFCWFSFFTDQGAARLSILLSGHPVIAYTTHLEKQDSMSNDNTIYFKSTKPVTNGYVKCNKMWIVRMPVIE